GRGWRAYLPFAGPAVVASIAYIDPGNFATNIQAGAKYGYGLLWVVLLANLVAMLFQGLSAKLGIVTGRNLAEFLGGAIGLALLLHLPLLAGMAVTGVVTYGLLLCEARGFRPLELIIGSIVGLIGLCYLAELFIVPVDWGAA